MGSLFGENVIVVCYKMRIFVILTFLIISRFAAAEDSKFFSDVIKLEAQSVEKYQEQVDSIDQYQKGSDSFINEAQEIIRQSSKNKYNGAMPDLLRGLGSIEKANNSTAPYDLMIFISSSIPRASLRNLAVEARRVGAVFILRGLVNNSFKQSVAYIRSLQEEGIGAIIDPHSYEVYQVKQVPAIVVVSDKNTCHPKICTPAHDKISGNISLQYALEEIAQRGVFGEVTAKKYLKRYGK